MHSGSRSLTIGEHRQRDLLKLHGCDGCNKQSGGERLIIRRSYSAITYPGLMRAVAEKLLYVIGVHSSYIVAPWSELKNILFGSHRDIANIKRV
jgi:hypothetical protein